MINLKIAWRYLFSPKSHSVVNAISWVSLVAVAVPVMAMVVILSLHNGLSSYIEGMYKDFDSQYQICTSPYGASFEVDSAFVAELGAIDGVRAVSRVVEQNVLLVSNEKSLIATLRGVDSVYNHVVPLANRVVQGKFSLDTTVAYNALVGQGVAYNLGINVGLWDGVEVFALPPKSRVQSLFESGAYRSTQIMPVGVYQLDEQTDSKYIFVDLTVAQELVGAVGRITSLEVALVEDDGSSSTVREIEQLLGRYPDLTMRTRFQQKESMYRIVSAEKLMIYALLVMVLLIAALSLAGQSLMLVTEKNRDITTLKVMGATVGRLRAIFLWQGMMLVAIGTLVGVVLGLILAWIQATWGVITMGGDSFLLSSYPIESRPGDVVGIVLTVLGLAFVLLGVTNRIIIKKR